MHILCDKQMQFVPTKLSATKDTSDWVSWPDLCITYNFDIEICRDHENRYKYGRGSRKDVLDGKPIKLYRFRCDLDFGSTERFCSWDTYYIPGKETVHQSSLNLRLFWRCDGVIRTYMVRFSKQNSWSLISLIIRGRHYLTFVWI